MLGIDIQLYIDIGYGTVADNRCYALLIRHRTVITSLYWNKYP